MLKFILIAELAGVLVGASRAINSRLGAYVGPLKASFWNHIIGFLFLSVVLFVTVGFKFNTLNNFPAFIYLGGFFGALFVVVNSYVFPRMGAVKTTLLVISGQMVFSVLFEYKHGAEFSILMQFLGVIIILVGIYLAKILTIK